MTASRTPRASLPLISVGGDAGAESKMIEATNMIDALILGGGVLDKDLSTPPGSPVNGDSYIVASGATGAWAGKEKSIAIYVDGWSFVPPFAGFSVWVQDESSFYHYVSSAWSAASAVVAQTTWWGATSIAASTTQTQGQMALTRMLNFVTTVANANDVVTLPAAVANLPVVIINRGANTLQVFPASGDAINGGAADASTTLATNKSCWFFAADSTNWYTLLGA